MSLIEAKLRPAVEVWSGCVALGAAFIIYMMPNWFMMTESVAYLSAGLLLLLALVRFKESLEVVRYRKRLRRLPYYGMSSKEVPKYGDSLFFGRGFRWGQRHTQRLKDTMNPAVRHYIEDSSPYHWARDFERKHGKHWLIKLTRWNSPLNPVRPLPPIGGNRVLHAVGIDEEKDVFVAGSDRPGNTLVLGTTRQGKSRLAEILLLQDIHRNDGPVILFDPKSDAALLTRMYTAAKQAGREDEFYCFHLGFPEMSARYNAIANFSRITEIATRVSNQLSGEGNSAAFKEFSWRFINVVARALVAIGEKPDYNNILHYVTDIEPLFRRFADYWLPRNADLSWQADVNLFEEEAAIQYKKNPRMAKYQSPRTEALRRYVEGMEASDGVMHGLLGALRYDAEFYSKLVASLIPLLEKVTTGKIGKLLAPDYTDTDDDRAIFDWTQIIRQKGVIYIGLDALQDLEIASVVGNSMFSDLVSTSGTIYKHGYEAGLVGGEEGKLPKIYLHADELNELIGPEFLPMVNKAAGSGVILTGYTQARADLEAAYGDKAMSQVIEGNFNNLIMLRVRDKHTAELMTDQLPEVETTTVMQVSGATDSSNVDSEQDFTSSTQDRVSVVSGPMLDPSALMSLPKGQAFMLVNGGELYKIRIPLPEDDHVSIPETLRQMTEQMQRTYTTGEQWWRGL
ncbi:type IV conjugative transfer system coupling protein TraD [Marinobacterium lutimaris]|uniref:Conjugative coupling factor TraD, TOL family n=1 Tax=Marinobacterium lutimaris TaxID=568106 RepID=A0A1H6DW09_9GAMM|nr:type IV conjugative transfer system coupling protein TraD [Marinobacterium lutimaris]SEG89532.1 conjugative coupling factor TraD, TOL family [Marinobacterium lutimaris]